MSTQSNAVIGSSRESAGIAPMEIPALRRNYWALRRELWENRFIYIAPLAAVGIGLFGFVLTLIHLPQTIRAASTLDWMHQHDIIQQPYDSVGTLMMGTFLLVMFFYCIETFQRERRDRSILFWKSLPVSDAMAVGAKVGIAFVVLPLLTIAITIAAQFLMLLVSSAVLAGSGSSVAAYWAQISFVQMSLLLFYHIVTVHVLWSAPIYGWLLLVSAWARRAAFLWAVLPPLAVGVLEKLLFNSAHFAAFLEGFLMGGPEGLSAPNSMPMDPGMHITPIRFLTTPGLWIGFAVTAAFLATAVWLRRHREPM